MSTNGHSHDAAREILDLDAADATSVRGGKKGSFDITNDAQGDPSQWGVQALSLNFTKVEV